VRTAGIEAGAGPPLPEAVTFGDIIDTADDKSVGSLQILQASRPADDGHFGNSHRGRALRISSNSPKMALIYIWKGTSPVSVRT
jgi:hypothetical protein